MQDSGFAYVADADFNCLSNRITNDYSVFLKESGFVGSAAEESADLICYRQMQSPILTHAPFAKKACDGTEFANLLIASSLESIEVENGEHPGFKHASGQVIETCKESIHKALLKLQPLWPRGLSVKYPVVEQDRFLKTRVVGPGSSCHDFVKFQCPRGQCYLEE